MAEVRIGNTLVGDGYPCFVIAEIGINHNGDMTIAKKLIDVAVAAGCNAVKFQKRTVDVVYTQEELARPRENPFGATNGDLKRGLEFGCEQYREIDAYCREKRILWVASCWDEASVDFIEQFDVRLPQGRLGLLTDDDLLKHIRSKGRPVIISTGMSNLDQIDHAVRLIGKQNLILLHSCSTYPAYYEELNLRVIPVLRAAIRRAGGILGPRDGHSLVGARPWPWGPASSSGTLPWIVPCGGPTRPPRWSPTASTRLVRDIRLIETSMGDGVKRVLDREVPIMQKLRRVGLRDRF